MNAAKDWPRINALLDEVLALEPDGRSAWLASLADREPDLAPRLRALLAAGPRAQAEGFLEERLDVLPDQSPLVGARVGAWVIESEIARGGMGSVWRARRDDGIFEGLAAIKFLHAADLGHDGEQRFRREGQLLATLNHPNIARLLDAGMYAATRQPYLVLEYIDGLPIDAWCERHALGLQARLNCFLQVVDAVAHAHAHLIVHRDLKPSNILVTAEGDVKLLDFGIARLVDADATTGDVRTRSRVTALTPQYAAPEQVLGEAITTRTDVYGLGLVLFRMLTGTHAIRWDGNGALLRDLVQLEIPAASRAAALDSVSAAQLAGDLDNVVARTLRKSPTERYSSATELADDIRRYLRHDPVLAQPTTVTYRVRKFIRRHRGAVAGATLTALALIAAVVITTTQMLEAQHQRDVARSEAERAQAQAQFTDHVITQLGDEGRPISRELVLDRSVDYVDKQYANRPKLAIGFYILLSGRYMNLGATEKELAVLEKALALARQTGDAEQIARVQCNTVETELSAGRIAQAEQRLADGRAALARVANPHYNRVYNCLYSEARVLSINGDKARAVAIAEQAARLLEEHDETGSLDYGSVVSLLVVVNQAEQNFAAALKWNETDLAALRKAGRDNSEDMAFALANRAGLLEDFGRPLEAESLYRKVIGRMQSGGNIDDVPPGITRSLGLTLYRLERFDEALQWLDRAVLRAAQNKAFITHVTSLVGRAQTRLAIDDIDGARADHAAAVALAQTDTAGNYQLLERARILEAEIVAQTGDVPRALAIAHEILTARAAEKTPRPTHVGLMRRIAEWSLAASDTATALRHASIALDTSRRATSGTGASAEIGHACQILFEIMTKQNNANGAAIAQRCALTNLEPTLPAGHSLLRKARNAAPGRAVRAKTYMQRTTNRINHG
jgi:serine/threonine-protein kinase